MRYFLCLLLLTLAPVHASLFQSAIDEANTFVTRQKAKLQEDAFVLGISFPPKLCKKYQPLSDQRNVEVDDEEKLATAYQLTVRAESALQTDLPLETKQNWERLLMTLHQDLAAREKYREVVRVVGMLEVDLLQAINPILLMVQQLGSDDTPEQNKESIATELKHLLAAAKTEEANYVEELKQKLHQTVQMIKNFMAAQRTAIQQKAIEVGIDKPPRFCTQYTGQDNVRQNRIIASERERVEGLKKSAEDAEGTEDEEDLLMVYQRAKVEFDQKLSDCERYEQLVNIMQNFQAELKAKTDMLMQTIQQLAQGLRPSDKVKFLEQAQAVLSN